MRIIQTCARAHGVGQSTNTPRVCAAPLEEVNGPCSTPDLRAAAVNRFPLALTSRVAGTSPPLKRRPALGLESVQRVNHRASSILSHAPVAETRVEAAVTAGVLKGESYHQARGYRSPAPRAGAWQSA
jgi:hypothetical protein